MSEETVRGIVRNVRLATEQGRNIPVELAIKVAKLPLLLLPDMFGRGGGAPVRVQKTRQIWSFILEIIGKSPYSHPLLTVEMTGKKTRGIVREGDEIIAFGYLNKDNVFIAKQIESLRTGEKIYCSRF